MSVEKPPLSGCKWFESGTIYTSFNVFHGAICRFTDPPTRQPITGHHPIPPAKTLTKAYQIEAKKKQRALQFSSRLGHSASFNNTTNSNASIPSHHSVPPEKHWQKPCHFVFVCSLVSEPRALDRIPWCSPNNYLQG